jgi:mannosyltransferase
VARRSTDRPLVDGVLVALTVVAAGLRLYGLGSQSLWYDEWLTTEAVGGGLGDLVHHVTDREGITPTYFVVTWGWVRVFGDGDLALRLLPALAGIATVPVAYFAALAFDLSRRVARLAALLVAVNPLLVWYSQEARPYSLLALAAGLSLLTFARARPPDTRWLPWWALAGAATVALHYFGAFLVGAEALLLLLAYRPRWQPVVLAALPAAAVGLVLVPFAIEQHSHGTNRDWISAFALSVRVRDAGRSALVGPSPPWRDHWIVPALVVAVAAVLLATRTGARDRRAGAVAAGIAAAGVAVPLAVSLVGTDVFLGRYVIGALVPLVLAVAIGLGASRPAGVGLAAAGVLTAASVAAVVAVARDPGLQRPDWQQVAGAVDEGATVVVVDVNGDQSSPLERYLPGAVPLGPDDAVAADRVDVLVGIPTDEPCNMLVGRACGMVFLGADVSGTVRSAFTPAGRDELDQFALDHYRADAPVRLTGADLVAPGAGAGAVVWVVEPTQ